MEIEIITAIIGLIGTIITAWFSYKGIIFTAKITALLKGIKTEDQYDFKNKPFNKNLL